LHGLSTHVISTEGADVGAAVDGADVGACDGTVGPAVVVCGSVGALVESSSQRSPYQPLQHVQFTPTNVVVVQLLLIRHSAADCSSASASG
jgi:hypothetical protein